jgi:hypothetical protein
VPEEDLVGALEADREASGALFRSIPESRAEHRYEPGKWSIREVIQHIVDSERVFGFRAFWFARNVASPLPGFEQDDVLRSAPAATPLSDVLSEFDHVRRGHIGLFRALAPEAWSRSGTASGNPISVRALAAILTGHSRHHGEILRQRYGV